MNSTSRHTTRRRLPKTRHSKTRPINLENISTLEKKLQLITSEGHIFNVIDESGSRIRVILRNRSSPCIQILINKDENSAILEEVSYYNSCSKTEPKEGAQHMCRSILKYLIDTYEFIDRIDVTDKSAYNITDRDLSFITARYLLQGKPGLYQNYLGAKPTDETRELIQLIEEKRDVLNQTHYSGSPSNNWWTYAHIKNLIENVFKEPVKAYKIKRAIFNNTWFLTKADIEQYDDTYSKRHVKKFQSGFQYKDSFETYIHNVTPIMYSSNSHRK